MKNNRGNIRFQKDAGPLDDIQDNVYGAVAEVFRWFAPEDLKIELLRWLWIALINDQSAYTDGSSREDLMDFCGELQDLMETLHVISQNQKPVKNAMLTVTKFCNTFTPSYARSELWDMLDSVSYYERRNSKPATEPLSVYRCLAALVEAAYLLS